MVLAAYCMASKAFRTAFSSMLLLWMMARIISSLSKLKVSAMVCKAPMRISQVFSVTINSMDTCVTSRNTAPIVWYDSYRLKYPSKLYYSMQSEMDTIWDAMSWHWHLPRLRILLSSANETSIDLCWIFCTLHRRRGRYFWTAAHSNRPFCRCDRKRV